MKSTKAHLESRPDDENQSNGDDKKPKPGSGN